MLMVRKLFVYVQRPWLGQFVDYLQRRSRKISSMNPFWLSKVNFAFYIWLRKTTRLFVKKEKQSQLSNYHHGTRHDGSHLTNMPKVGHFEISMALIFRQQYDSNVEKNIISNSTHFNGWSQSAFMFIENAEVLVFLPMSSKVKMFPNPLWPWG